jgi:hypothetical protein
MSSDSLSSLPENLQSFDAYQKISELVDKAQNEHFYSGYNAIMDMYKLASEHSNPDLLLEMFDTDGLADLLNTDGSEEKKRTILYLLSKLKTLKGTKKGLLFILGIVGLSGSTIWEWYDINKMVDEGDISEGFFEKIDPCQIVVDLGLSNVSLDDDIEERIAKLFDTFVFVCVSIAEIRWIKPLIDNVTVVAEIDIEVLENLVSEYDYCEFVKKLPHLNSRLVGLGHQGGPLLIGPSLTVDEFRVFDTGKTEGEVGDDKLWYVGESEPDGYVLVNEDLIVGRFNVADYKSVDLIGPETLIVGPSVFYEDFVTGDYPLEDYENIEDCGRSVLESHTESWLVDERHIKQLTSTPFIVSPTTIIPGDYIVGAVDPNDDDDAITTEVTEHVTTEIEIISNKVDTLEEGFSESYIKTPTEIPTLVGDYDVGDFVVGDSYFITGYEEKVIVEEQQVVEEVFKVNRSLIVGDFTVGAGAIAGSGITVGDFVVGGSINLVEPDHRIINDVLVTNFSTSMEDTIEASTDESITLIQDGFSESYIKTQTVFPTLVGEHTVGTFSVGVPLVISGYDGSIGTGEDHTISEEEPRINFGLVVGNFIVGIDAIVEYDYRYAISDNISFIIEDF